MTSDLATDQRNHNWFAIDRPVLDMGLQPVTLSLYVVIASYINSKTGGAFPGISTISKKLGVSRSTVIRHTKKLEDLGLLRVVRDQTTSGENKVNHYYLMPVGGGPLETLPSVTGEPGVVHQRHPNNKNINNKKEQETENAEKSQDEGVVHIKDQPDALAVTSTARTAPKKPKRSAADTLKLPDFEDMLAVVGEVFKHHGAERMRTLHMLKGTYTKRRELNLDEPATVDEVRRFGKWYRGKYQDIDMPKDPVKVQSHFLAFREAEAQNKAVQVVVRELVPVAEEEISEEELARRRADTAAAKAAVRGAA